MHWSSYFIPVCDNLSEGFIDYCSRHTNDHEVSKKAGANLLKQVAPDVNALHIYSAVFLVGARYRLTGIVDAVKKWSVDVLVIGTANHCCPARFMIGSIAG